MEGIKTKKENQKPMNENLSELLQSEVPETPQTFSEDELITALPPISSSEDIIQDEVPVPTQTARITTLVDWFEGNCGNFDNINQVKVSIRGVDAARTLIMAVKDESGEKDADGNDKRTLRVFEHADELPVLNLPAISMNIFNNGFRIIYAFNESLYIKTYGLKTGLISVFCNSINGKLIPYAINRSKKKDVELEIINTPPLQGIQNKLGQNVDKESLQLLYKQSTKAVDEMTTNMSAIEWLVDRQETVTDINHHLQIDNVIMDILK